MRAYEFLNEDRSPPSKPITLRVLHQMKLAQKRREASERERMVLMPLMYGDADRHREQLELERLELEMMQLQADINATNAETAVKSSMVIHKNAKSGINATEKSQQKLTKLAKSGIGRSLKL